MEIMKLAIGINRKQMRAVDRKQEFIWSGLISTLDPTMKR